MALCGEVPWLTLMMEKSQHILNSWQSNAHHWIESIDQNQIESRKLITNLAIVEAILKYKPSKVLDLGCGEGWLTRTLTEKGLQAVGIDGTKGLIENALQKDKGIFEVITYEEIIGGVEIPHAPFDCIVINFGLFMDEEVQALLEKLNLSLTSNGKILIQTLHPFSILNQDKPYLSNWEENGWAGLGEQYTEPFKWFSRTLGDWVSLLVNTGYQIQEIQEPLNPITQKPQSMIFVVKAP